MGEFSGYRPDDDTSGTGRGAKEACHVGVYAEIEEKKKRRSINLHVLATQEEYDDDKKEKETIPNFGFSIHMIRVKSKSTTFYSAGGVHFRRR